MVAIFFAIRQEATKRNARKAVNAARKCLIRRTPPHLEGDNALIGEWSTKQKHGVTGLRRLGHPVNVRGRRCYRYRPSVNPWRTQKAQMPRQRGEANMQPHVDDPGIRQQITRHWKYLQVSLLLRLLCCRFAWMVWLVECFSSLPFPSLPFPSLSVSRTREREREISCRDACVYRYRY